MDFARAQFASLMASGLHPGPRILSYRDKVVQFPEQSITAHQQKRHRRLPRDQQIRQKIEEIRTRSTPLHPICMRCGEKGHKAHDCRNARLCFICNKTGHKGAYCATVPSPSPHSHPSSWETNRPTESSAMAPPRRGYPRARPPFRPYQRQPPGPSEVLRSAPAPPVQVPPDRPFTGLSQPQPQSASHQAPPQAPGRNEMIQTPSDRPVQRTQ